MNTFISARCIHSSRPVLLVDGKPVRHRPEKGRCIHSSRPVLLVAGLALLTAMGRLETLAATAANKPEPASLILVDSSVADLIPSLVEQSPESRIRVLSAQLPLQTQIETAVAGLSDVKAIHLISHGAPGSLQLAGRIHGVADLTGPDREIWTNLRRRLSTEAEILIYGCEFAKGEVGRHSVEALASLTGAKVAASINRTGAAGLGGDWKLEASTAPLNTAALTAPEWSGVLAPMTISVSGAPTLSGGTGLNGRAVWTNAGNIGGTPIDVRATVIAVNSGTANVAFSTSGNDMRITMNGVASLTVRWEVFASGSGQTIPAYGNPNFRIADIDGNGTGSAFPAVQIEAVAPSVNGLSGYTVSAPTNLEAGVVSGTLLVRGTQNESSGPTSLVGFDWTNVTSWDVTYTVTATNRLFYHDGNGDLTFTSPDTTPLLGLDLDPNDSSGATGNNYTVQYGVGYPAIPIADTDEAVSGITQHVVLGTDLHGATIVLTNAMPGDILTLGSLPSGITGSVDTSIPGKITVTLSGTASVASYQNAIRAISYSNSLGSPNMTARTIESTVTNTTFGTTSSVATTTVNLAILNTAPVANNDTATTVAVGTNPSVNVLANDTDAQDGSPPPASTPVDLNPAVVGIQTTFTNAQGTFTVVSGVVTFTPTNPNFTGTASVSYQITDSGGMVSNTATASFPVILGTDTDGDGIADAVDLDDDNDGIPDTVEAATALNGGDTDGDGIPDRIDLDSDNDGILDIAESGRPAGADLNNDGRLDGAVGTDGIPDSVQSSPNAGTINYTIADTDGDGRPDFQDLDSDNDGINDVREANGTDANGDGLADGTPVDSNGIRTSVPAGGLVPPDTDGDGRPDFRDLDSDNDGINDVIENGGTDANLDGLADGTDADGDGIRSSADGTPGVWGDSGDPAPANGDNDSVPNFRDLDSDNDSVPDVIEGGNGAADTNGDGTIGAGDASTADTDGDGIANVVDNLPSTYGDAGGSAPPNTDGTGAPDYLDLDSDDDGLTDLVEAGRNPAVLDANGDGQIDGPIVDGDGDGIAELGGIDVLPAVFAGILAPSAVVDTDGDGIPDVVDLDDDNDGILDTVELATALNGGDTDGDGIPDTLDLDSDGDGILDIDEAGHTGADANHDGRVDGPYGLNGFANALETAAESGVATYTVADTDGDGHPDFQDLDSDNDGINDVREANGTDANGDGLADGGPVSSSGVATTVPADGLVPPDTDGDGHPDFRDLDSDNDGINDVVENGGSDPDNNGIIGTGALPTDTDGDGIADVADGAPAVFGDSGDPAPANGDNDSVPNFRDLDSDNDSISDVIEGGNGAADTNGDGTIGAGDASSTDGDGDGIPDVVDNSPATFGDAGGSAPPNTDGTGGPDYLDLDSDGDGLTDLVEGGRNPVVLDTNGDGQLDGPINDPDGDGISDNGGIDTLPGTFGGILPPSTPVDTDGDGIPDVVDLDDDNDGILDTVEALTAINGGDTDGDGVPDSLDLDSDGDGILDIDEAGHTGADANHDGRVDGPYGLNGFANALETAAESGTPVYTPVDTDGDGHPDFQDLDSDNDGLYDVIEANGTDADGNGRADGAVTASGIASTVPADGLTPPDTDGDSHPDFRDLDSDNDGINDVREGNGTDANGDGKADGAISSTGVPASVPGTGLTPPDTDGDFIPDYRDLDSDNDGINDVIENGGTDANLDGLADGTDVDGDGIRSSADGTPGVWGDSGDPVPANGDNDSVPNYRDLDSDNDTIPDVIEGGNGAADTNGDGVADGPDTDGDGILDVLDNAPSSFGDAGGVAPPNTDGDPLPDYLDVDSDGDGTMDIRQKTPNGRLDANNDGMIDSPVDADGDGIADNSGVDATPTVFGGLGAPAPLLPVKFEAALAGDPAPGMGDPATRFVDWFDFSINNSGKVIAHGITVSPVKDITRDEGVWTDATSPNPILLAREGDLIPGSNGGVVGRIFQHLKISDTGVGHFMSNITGVLVTENLAGWVDNGSVVTPYALKGQQFSVLYHGANQPFDSGDAWFTACLKLGGSVKSTNDTGIWKVTPDGTVTEAVREGMTLTGKMKLGQFFSPMSVAGGVGVYAAYLTGVPSTMNAALFKQDFANGGAPQIVCEKGDAADGCGTAKFSLFCGASINSSGNVVSECMLASSALTGVNTTNNEGLWSDRNGGWRLVVRKGQPLPEVGADMILARVDHYWILQDDSVVFTGILAGPGVTTTNDMCILRVNVDGVITLVAREGMVLPTVGNSEVAMIQRFDISPNGRIVLLCNLKPGVGDTVGYTNNQVLIRSLVDNPVYDIVIRKNEQYGISGPKPRRIVALALDGILGSGNGGRYTGVAGTGSGGQGRFINESGQVVFKVSFSDYTKGLFVSQSQPDPQGGVITIQPN